MKILLLIILSYSNLACSDTYEIRPSAGFDNENMQMAFLMAKFSHDVVLIRSGTYDISVPMPEITKPLVVKSDGRAVINYTGVTPLFTVASRNVEIVGLRIKGDKISSGIIAKNGSWLDLKNTSLVSLNVALEMDNFHDSDITGVKFYANNIDFLAEKRQITSIKFTSCHFERANYAVKINTTSTNMVFSDSGFSPSGTDNPIQITNPTFGGVFENNRVELKGLSNGIYIQGQSHTYPAQTMRIINNYFTGNIVSAIYLDVYTNNNTISGNHFQGNPAAADITNKGIGNLLVADNQPSVHLNRDIIIGK